MIVKNAIILIWQFLESEIHPEFSIPDRFRMAGGGETLADARILQLAKRPLEWKYCMFHKSNIPAPANSYSPSTWTSGWHWHNSRGDTGITARGPLGDTGITHVVTLALQHVGPWVTLAWLGLSPDTDRNQNSDFTYTSYIPRCLHQYYLFFSVAYKLKLTLNLLLVHFTPIKKSRSILSVCIFGLKNTKVKKVPYLIIWPIQINIHPETSFAPKYNAFYSNNIVMVHTINLVLWLLLVKLSWRVDPTFRTSLLNKYISKYKMKAHKITFSPFNILKLAK